MSELPPIEVDWLIMECVYPCGKRRKRRGKCQCETKREQQRVFEALPDADREWVLTELRRAEGR